MPTPKAIQDEEIVLTKPRIKKVEVQEVQEEEPFNFIYNNRTFESYEKHKITHLIKQELKDQDQEAKFLNDVKPQKLEDVERVITRFVRVKKPDYLAKGQHIIKDYLYYYENWYGRDWKGDPSTIPPVTDHIEGKYFEQDIKPAPFVNGRPTGEFKRTGQHEVWYIEFSKERLDEIINRQKAHRDEIEYVIGLGSAKRVAPKNSVSFTYEQFSTLSFDELEKLTH